jgi:hypothetical protein
MKKLALAWLASSAAFSVAFLKELADDAGQ